MGGGYFVNGFCRLSKPRICFEKKAVLISKSPPNFMSLPAGTVPCIIVDVHRKKDSR